nr:MAG TPA: adenine specific DNA methyltransferase [Caudoviricetes sp.]
MNIINIKLSDLKPYERNPRNNKEAVDYVANSIREFGFKNPIIVDKNNVIVAGHTRYLACKKLGIKEVPCIIADDLTDEQIKAFRLADNKVAEIATWDLDLLDEELNDLLNFDMSDFGFDVDLEEFEEAQEDEFDIDELPEEPKAKLGDIYQLGNHRLMCGDSTDEKDVNKLVGEATIDLLITDPPYNVDYTGKTEDALKIENDKMENDAFHEFLVNAFTNAYNVIKGGGCFYCWYASKEVVNFHTSLEESGFTVKQELIWNKNSMVMGRQDYQWKHEPCLYGWKETDPHVWYGDRKQTTVIDWNRPTKSDLHPTMKPIGLFDYQIRNSTKQGENVLDLFGGSGTTIMACEQNDRHAYVMEYDPKYVDVIISRWEQYTGKKARKVKG